MIEKLNRQMIFAGYARFDLFNGFIGLITTSELHEGQM